MKKRKNTVCVGLCRAIDWSLRKASNPIEGLNNPTQPYTLFRVPADFSDVFRGYGSSDSTITSIFN